MGNNDTIAQALDLSPMQDTQVATIEQEANNDYEYARQNIYAIIQTGANALDELAQIAAQSQSPRAYEVLSTLVKTLVDANKDLMNLKEKNIEINLKSETNYNADNRSQTNLFIGSTAELQKLLKGIKTDGS
jgi:hypothetical protein